MNWHDTIDFIRKDSKYESLVKEAYLLNDLKLNIELFRNSEEFKKTLELIVSLNKNKSLKILDIGAGNGISSIAFAMYGFVVTAVEPDTSTSIGSGAINEMKAVYDLKNLEVYNCFAEELPFDNETFDIVYARQTMHHAYNLNQFSKSVFRVLKNRGYFITVRDHVIKNDREKMKFFKIHPLHKFYGGENAFTLKEYKNSFINAGFDIRLILRPIDSVINYSPWSKKRLSKFLEVSFGKWASFYFFVNFLWPILIYRQTMIPGRLYSFLLQK